MRELFEEERLEEEDFFTREEEELRELEREMLLVEDLSLEEGRLTERLFGFGLSRVMYL